jgi:hypothetical protein
MNWHVALDVETTGLPSRKFKKLLKFEIKSFQIQNRYDE